MSVEFVDSAWLAAHLEDLSAIAVDCRLPEEYAGGHVPGALNAYPYGPPALSTPQGQASFRAFVVEYMTNLGITGTETLVFYAAVNETTDARGLWTAEFAGYRQVALLAGGLRQWVADGHALSTDPARRAPVAFMPRWDESVYATADDVVARIGKPDAVLLDVRSEDEYTGSASGRYAGVNPRLGRVPGAVWLEWTELRDADGSYKSPAAIRALLAAHGVTPEQEVVTYCQGGGRAAHAYAALKSAGFDHVRHYVGSFGDYAQRGDLPIESDENGKGP